MGITLWYYILHLVRLRHWQRQNSFLSIGTCHVKLNKVADVTFCPSLVSDLDDGWSTCLRKNHLGDQACGNQPWEEVQHLGHKCHHGQDEGWFRPPAPNQVNATGVNRPSLSVLSVCFAGDGSASPAELFRPLGCSDTASHPVSEQADWDRCPQETQLHPRSGTAHTLLWCSPQSMCPDYFSLMEYLFIFQGLCVL